MGSEEKAKPAFAAFKDRFEGVAEINKELKRVGLTKCGLIFGIDYTISNSIQGEKTFDEQNLHYISQKTVNPYQETICILGEVLEPFNDDGCIRAYGFGHDHRDKTDNPGFFPLKDEGDFEGFEELLEAYAEVTPTVKLGAPTYFAPLVGEALRIVKSTKKYHILVIVTDGQLCDNKDTTNVIVEASHYPLSIIVIGVGDGPWDMMQRFDDGLPARQFDNFQFVEFQKIKSESRNPQAAVALATLMEIPDQYSYMVEHGYL